MPRGHAKVSSECCCVAMAWNDGMEHQKDASTKGDMRAFSPSRLSMPWTDLCERHQPQPLNPSSSSLCSIRELKSEIQLGRCSSLTSQEPLGNFQVTVQYACDFSYRSPTAFAPQQD